MADRVECVVIGAGVVGLAVARSLARSGRETLVLEAAAAIGTGVSARNSEVIHAGLYYPPGSLKARLCVAGRRMLYEFCAARAVQARRCGKLIVATTPQQVATLARIRQVGQENGVGDLELLDREQVHALEPELECVAALRSPSTGILDSQAFMRALQEDLEAAGGTVVLSSPVQGGDCSARAIRLRVGPGDYEIEGRVVVNCAGLGAQQVAGALHGLDPSAIPRLYYAKGSYFALQGRSPFQHLIYPVPEAGGLGVHLTHDLAGRARFGPDVEWTEDLDYRVDPSRQAAFYSAIRSYWPSLPDGALRPDYAGIRPKLSAAGAVPEDFVIQGPSAHGCSGLVNLFGIESPGLTASLAIAAHVTGLL